MRYHPIFRPLYSWLTRLPLWVRYLAFYVAVLVAYQVLSLTMLILLLGLGTGWMLTSARNSLIRQRPRRTWTKR